MENTSQQALIPLEQAIIPFHGSQILSAWLPGNRAAAILNSLCTMLGIQSGPQVQRIRKSKDLAEHLLFAQIETAGGPQRMAVLVAEAIPFWAVRLRFDQIAPEKQKFIIFLKMEAVETLYGYFYQSDNKRVAQPTPEPQVEPLPPPAPGKSGAAPESSWGRLFEALHGIRQEEQALAGRLAVVEEWLTSLDRRVTGTGQGRAAEMGWLPLLSAAHLADLRLLLRSLEQTTGRTQPQLEQELVETFGVPAINAIPDEQWEDVLAWYAWRAQQTT